MPALEAHDDPDEKAPSAFRTISETASFLGVPQHVLRFWESRFSQIRPLKLRGGRRYYRPEDIEILTTIKTLLYKQGYTIKGAKKAFGKDALPEAADAKPAVTDPPGVFKYNLMSFLGSSCSKNKSWAITVFATASVIGPHKKTILSFKRRE